MPAATFLLLRQRVFTRDNSPSRTSPPINSRRTQDQDAHFAFEIGSLADKFAFKNALAVEEIGICKRLDYPPSRYPACYLYRRYPRGVISADDGSSSHLRTLSRGGLAGGWRESVICAGAAHLNVSSLHDRMDGVRPGSTSKCLLPRHAWQTQ